jgi:methionyl-tRNA formyltransferase
MIKILAADVVTQENQNKPGTILNVDREGICVATSEGILKIKKLKPEGKSEMDAWSFVCGHKLKEGENFSSSKQA